MSRQITFTEAIKEALETALRKDPNVVCFGLGIDDPKGIFGTTLGLKESFGPERIFDMPTSENAMTGIAVGMAINGMYPVMVHQRMDFFLLAMDQLVNNAAKWHFMFNGQQSVPLTIRLICGRGWGQGPTHSQNLHSWFSHIPGLKVVCPTNPYDAKGLLLSSIFDPNPVIFIEHRWLHQSVGDVPKEAYQIPLEEAEVVKEGSDLTIVGLSYMIPEAIQALDVGAKHSVSADLIDLRSLNPIDWDKIMGSVKKTGRLLVLDTAHLTGSLSGEIVSRVTTECFDYLKTAPIRISVPDIPTPTSFALTKDYYPGVREILGAIEKLCDASLDYQLLEPAFHDVPGEWFKGPF